MHSADLGTTKAFATLMKAGDIAAAAAAAAAATTTIASSTPILAVR